MKDVQESDTPRTDAIGYDPALAQDYREWMHLAIQLERELKTANGLVDEYERLWLKALEERSK
jgi:hypothetical protein